MSIQDRDFLIRIIQQLGEALARIAGLRNAGKHDEALSVVRETADGLLGPMARTIEVLDANSAAMLLSAPRKIQVYAALTEERARVYAQRGDEARARADDLRALELYLLSARDLEELPQDLRRSILDLAARVDSRRLESRTRATLESIASQSR